ACPTGLPAVPGPPGCGPPGIPKFSIANGASPREAPGLLMLMGLGGDRVGGFFLPSSLARAWARFSASFCLASRNFVTASMSASRFSWESWAMRARRSNISLSASTCIRCASRAASCWLRWSEKRSLSLSGSNRLLATAEAPHDEAQGHELHGLLRGQVGHHLGLLLLALLEVEGGCDVVEGAEPREQVVDAAVVFHGAAEPLHHRPAVRGDEVPGSRHDGVGVDEPGASRHTEAAEQGGEVGRGGVRHGSG